MKYSSKNYYREYFASVKDMIKFKYFLNQCNISRSNFSHFMKGQEYDMLLSVEKLDLLTRTIDSEISKIKIV